MRPRGTTAALLLYLGAVLPTQLLASEPLRNERDHPRSWHDAVISLQVPTSKVIDGYRQHHIEDCSGTLVATEPLTVLTAWHCFDGYRDLTQSPRVLVEGQWLDGRLEASGQSMEADWAIVTVVHHKASIEPIPLASAAPMPNQRITMAGYSTALAPAEGLLTFREACRVSSVGLFWFESDCHTSKGASGGPILIGGEGAPRVVGVISARRASGELLAVPVSRLPAPWRHRLTRPSEDGNATAD